jgi:hypothetical protein
MRGATKALLATALTVLAAAGFAACGGEEPDGSTAGSTTAPRGATGEAGGAGGGGGEPRSDPSAAEGSAAFRTPGGDNSVQDFGEEADAEEVEAASTALAAYMRARAEGDWAGQCAHLAAVTLKPLERFAAATPQLEGKGCAGLLAALSGSEAASDRANTMTGAIDSLRVEGERGFALYHGSGGTDYFVPMIEQGEEWKVGALAPSEFP